MSINRSIRRASLTVPAAAAAMLALSAGGASALPLAQPIGGGDPPLPINLAPKAKLVASPKVALVSHQLQVQAKKLDLSEVFAGDGDVVKFDASGSTDPEDGPLTYDWDLDGNGSYELLNKDPKQSKRYYATGTVTVKVRVHDEGGKTDTESEQIIIHAAPKAKITSDVAVPIVGQTVKYDSAGSTGDPAIVKHEWDLDGNGSFETNSGSGGTAGASYQTPGPRTIKLRVTDTYGVTAVASIVEKVNQLPTAAFTNGPAVAGQSVQFDGSGSGDDVAISTYEWDLDGDGTFETNTLGAPSVSKVYPTAGTVNVRLRVTDDLGATSVVAHAVQVAPAATGKPLGTSGTPGAGPSSGPRVSLSKTKFRLAKNGRVTIKLTTLAGEGSVKGTVKLRTRGKRGKTLATRSFRASGGSKSVSLLLPAVQRRAIRRGHVLKATIVIAAGNASGVKRTETLGILIGL